MRYDLPAEASGLRLARIDRNGDLILCESVIFHGGPPAVDMVLRRAAISGHVEISKGDTPLPDYFADVMNFDDDTIVECVELDRKSYSALKNRWMRCRVMDPLRDRIKALGLSNAQLDVQERK